MSTIPWDKLVEAGKVSEDEANLFASVVQRHADGVWSFWGYIDLADDERERLAEVIVDLCRPRAQ